ncbi:hypothetical protein DNK55_09475 [Streptomyces sp. AC1-42T]|nr:hypothetical protein DNK55_09475 [Streptomyces sp. AC1-42T]
MCYFTDGHTRQCQDRAGYGEESYRRGPGQKEVGVHEVLFAFRPLSGDYLTDVHWTLPICFEGRMTRIGMSRG